MPVTDRLRRRGILPAAVLLLAAPALASCGFDYQTDRVNNVAPGTEDRSGDVKVLGAAVVAEADGSGVFIATLANNGTEGDTLDDITGEGAEGATLEVAGQIPAVEIPVGGRVNLIEEGGIPVTGEFAAGDFVTVTLTFGNGQTTSLDTNVLRPCYQYSPEKLGELNFPGGGENIGSTEGSPEEAAEESTESSGSTEESEESSEGGSTEDESGPDVYSCDSYESDVWRSGEEPHHSEAQ